tara:strand:- start:1406 stop:1726 length:321 start_codon:yes stop_codon:yes gene_type:complete
MFGRFDIDDLIRRTRSTNQQKQEKMKLLNRKPTNAEGNNGDMVAFNDSLFIKTDNSWLEFKAKSKFTIKKLTDLTYTAGTASIVADLDTLKKKINEIIDILKLEIK